MKKQFISFVLTACCTAATYAQALTDFKPAANVEAKKQDSIVLSGAQRTLSCFQSAERKFMIPMELLLGIAEQESSFNPRAVGVNTNSTRDYGLMQINSSWFPKLAQYGVDPQSLFDPCVSIDVGAWILHDNIKRFGNNWIALAKYNAAKNMIKGHAYATSVFGRAKRIEAQIGRDASKLVALISKGHAAKVQSSEKMYSPVNKEKPKKQEYIPAETWQVALMN